MRHNQPNADSHEDDEDVRTSLYLVRRAEALLGTLKFFLKPSGNPVARRLVFLAQFDFWDWEMDNLIYSFTSFAERSESWRSAEHVNAKLWKLGVPVDVQLSGRMRWRGGIWHVQQQEGGRRVAPVELLAETVEAWNQLIDLAEMHFVKPARKKVEAYNIQALTSLQHLKKAMPNVEQFRSDPT